MRAIGRRAAWVPAAAAAIASGCATDAPQLASAPREAAAGAVGGSWITEVATKEQPWRFGDYAGRIVTTSNYRLYTTVSRHSMLERLPVFLERGLVHYRTALGMLPEPPGRLETFLFETKNQWDAKTRQMLPDQAATFLMLGRGGFTTRGTSVLYYIGSDTLAIAAHEGWHQYSQRTFRQQLPLWLEEGIATYMEGYLSHPDGLPKFHPWANLERYHALRDAVRADRLLPLSEILERPPQSFLETGKADLLVYYAQVWALTHFLAEGEGGRYRPALEDMIADAAAGRLGGRSSSDRGAHASTRLGPPLLVQYFETDLEAFEAAYIEFMRAITRTGGRESIVQGRSPAG